jgi:hypothetical protein
MAISPAIPPFLLDDWSYASFLDIRIWLNPALSGDVSRDPFFLWGENTWRSALLTRCVNMALCAFFELKLTFFFQFFSIFKSRMALFRFITRQNFCINYLSRKEQIGAAWRRGVFSASSRR